MTNTIIIAVNQATQRICIRIRVVEPSDAAAQRSFHSTDSSALLSCFHLPA